MGVVDDTVLLRGVKTFGKGQCAEMSITLCGHLVWCGCSSASCGFNLKKINFYAVQ